MFIDSYNEEHKARRARLGFVEPKPSQVRPVPVLAAPQKVEEVEEEHHPEDEELAGVETWKRIVRSVIDKHGIGMKDLLSSLRSKHIAKARQEACYRMATETKMSYPAISKRVGYKDHTSSIYAAAKYAAENGLVLAARIHFSSSEERDSKMYEMARSGVSYQEIADHFNLSKTHTNNVCIAYALKHKLRHPTVK